MKKRSTLFILLFLLVPFTAVFAQGTWAPLVSGTATTLLGVSAPSNNTAFVCGQGGLIRKTVNAGITWNPLSSGTLQNLHSIEFIDVLTGYAVGDGGTALKTTNGGSTWVPLVTGTSTGLRFVHFSDASNGYICGLSGLIMKTIDGGGTWTTLTTGTASQLNSFWFVSPTIGYATGSTGALIRTNTAGTSWVGLASGVVTNLNIVQFQSTTNGIICGDGGIIRQTITSGASWSPIASGTTNNLTGMDFYDANNGFIVGGNTPLDTGIILRTIDGGNTWTSMGSGTNRLTKTDFYDENLGYAVGLNGTIIQYTVPLPPSPPDAEFSISTPSCMGQGQNFYSVMFGIPGVTHQWNFGTGAAPATSNLYNPSGILYAVPGAKVITHIATTALGSDTVVKILTVNPQPIANFSSDAPACPGAPINFMNAGTTGVGVTYDWDFGGATPNISTINNPVNIVYATGGTKTVTFTVTNQYGCTTTNVQTINVHTPPAAMAGIDSTICYNNTVQLGDTAMPGLTYSWSPATSLSDPNISNPVATPVASSTTYVLTVTDPATGCSGKDTAMIFMQPALIANAGPDVELCKDDSAQIGTGMILGQTYSWSPSTGLSDTTISNPITTTLSTITYTLTVSQNGCGNITDQVTVNVNAAPLVSAGMDDTTALGGSVQLNASGGVSYVWSPSATLNNASIYNPIATPTATTTYTVVITDLNGCRTSDAVKVTVVEPAFWVPTAFTPDDNGFSDVFFVRGEGILDFEFSIFNRWGEKIFFTKDQMTGWDGTRQSTGDKMPAGAYVYQIRGTLSNGNPMDEKGMVNLIR